MINYIYGGLFDNKMMDTIGSYNVPYVLMHTYGSLENMHKNPKYENVVKEIIVGAK